MFTIDVVDGDGTAEESILRTLHFYFDKLPWNHFGKGSGLCQAQKNIFVIKMFQCLYFKV